MAGCAADDPEMWGGRGIVSRTRRPGNINTGFTNTATPPAPFRQQPPPIRRIRFHLPRRLPMH
jgi:hypothetical protein